MPLLLLLLQGGKHAHSVPCGLLLSSPRYISSLIAFTSRPLLALHKQAQTVYGRCLWHTIVLRCSNLMQGEATLAATRAQTMLGRLL